MYVTRQLGKTVVNLSAEEFDNDQISLLKLGTNFVPTPKVTSKTPILEASKKFARSLKLKWHFRNSTHDFKKDFQGPSTFEPPDKDMPPELLETIKKIDDEISELQIPKDNPNMSPSQIQALEKLKSNQNIIIKKADKGSSTVIMNRDAYIREGMRQLNDPVFYEKLPAPIFPQTAETVLDIVSDLKQKGFIDEKQFNFLKPPQDPRPRIFYFLPKIHKPLSKWSALDQPPGRPIVSDCSSESYEITAYIEKFLKPLATKHPSYIRDTTDFLNKLRRHKFSKNSILVTADVVSLYPNIPHKDGLKAVSDALKASKNETTANRPDEHILKLLELCLYKNDFEFDGKFYLQKQGCSMGRRFSVSYANIFMAAWEKSALARHYLQPTVWYRFLDDIFFVWDHGRKSLDDFLKALNMHAKTIKLTENAHDIHNEFMDVTAYKGERFDETGLLDFKLFFKPTDSHQLLHNNSFHPKHTFKGILKGQIKRFYRICTQKSDFEEACTIVFQALRERGYSQRFLRYVKSETLQEVEAGAYIQPPPDYGNDDKESELVEPCLNPFCPMCHNFKSTDFVRSNNSGYNYKITEKMSCNTSNIIYLVECKECGIQYIGETSMSLRARTQKHRHTIYDDIESVGHHFNSGACLLDDFQVTPIFKCPKVIKYDGQNIDLEATRKATKNNRRAIEQYFIKQFQTQIPGGLNVQVYKPKDAPTIAFCNKYSGLAKKASRVVRENYSKLQEFYPKVFKHHLVSSYSRNKNLSDSLISAKIKQFP